MDNQLRYLQEEVAREKAAADMWRLRAIRTREQANRELSRLNDQILQLTNQVMELAKRPPVVLQPQSVDVAQIVGQIGDALGKVLGYNAPVSPQETSIPMRAMEDHGMTPSTGLQPGETYYPDVEFDPWLGDQPQRAGWVNPATNAQTPPPDSQHPVHQVNNGKVVRMDGQPLFQSGQSAVPPTGGVE